MSKQTDWIQSIAPYAKQASLKTGMSVELMLAQAAQETGWGQKVLSGTNNLFNIKADSSWTGETKTFQVPEYVNGKWITIEATFRSYPTVEDAFIDRVNFLKNNPRYAKLGLFDEGTLGNPQAEALALQKAGYATDPEYASNLMKVANGPTMQSALHSNDRAVIDLPNGDSIDATLPEGTRVVSTSTTLNGQTTVTTQLVDKDGHVLLSAGAGQTMERDPETGIVQVLTGTSDQVQQYDPATGEVSNALRTGSDAAHFYENLVDAFSNPQVQFSNGMLVADNSDALPNKADGQTSNVELQDLTQGIGLFNGLSNLQNWDHLSDVGKLQAVMGFYNSVDGLGAAFGGTGNNLPGDFAETAGWLNLAQGVQSGDGLIIASGINQVSDRSLDNAMNEAFGNTAAGESVPYLSYALAIRNFEDNPEHVMLTTAGIYLSEAANDDEMRKVA